MSKFIKLHDWEEQEPMYVRIDKIRRAKDYVFGRGTIELDSYTCIIVSETLEEIMKLIEEAENE